jgi:hypothetical protein
VDFWKALEVKAGTEGWLRIDGRESAAVDEGSCDGGHRKKGSCVVVDEETRDKK